MGAVERRALFDDAPQASPPLGDVLSRYAGAIDRADTSIPLRRKTRGGAT